MAVFNVHEAKTNLSKLLERVEAGEEILIARAGRPVAKLVVYEEQQLRPPPGSFGGEIWIADDFDDPLPADILAAFNGEVD